ncbi:MAG: glutaredoxin [Candidatus Paceibacterota bacterium]|jgi:glutaredoxin|nr:glutaredoxin [Candidatus Paceibacterota bacterium]
MSSKKKNELKNVPNAEAKNMKIKNLPDLYKFSVLAGIFICSWIFGFLFSGALPLSVADTRAVAAVSLYAASGTVDEERTESSANIYFFGREDCSFCKAEKKFLDPYIAANPGVVLTYYDIVKDPKAKELFVKIAAANDLPQVTPLTLVGGQVIQGYGGEETTGKEIIAAVAAAKDGKNAPLASYETKGSVSKSGSGCDASGEECGIEGPGKPNLVFNVPFFGQADLKDLSLFSLSAMLGFIDGFNPCALWVLITFLIALMQIGSRKKMFYVAGLFLLAEAIMYYAILTAWYKTWDFVGLDQVVTPLVGLLSLGSGIFFVYRWKKAKDTVTCDVTDIDHQEKISSKIQALASAPLTIATAFGIVGIALSVNVIEFACSIGIPQVFTKTLELNQPSFWQYQGYLLIYMLGYMVDDIVVFGFALYGINKIHESEKYSKLSLLIGGILMLILGTLLTFFPNLLVF